MADWVGRVLTFREGMSVEVYVLVDADVSAASACCSVQFLRQSGGLNTYVSPLLVRV
jgi:hypothetical protein